MEGERRQCQLCPAKYKYAKSLREHYAKKHGREKGDPLLQAIPKSPKRECRRCGKSVSNIWAHEKSCKARKRAIGDATTSDETPDPSPLKSSTSGSSAQQTLGSQGGSPADSERLSNQGFLELYRQWLASPRGNCAGGNTIKDYARHVGNFIEAQTAERVGFRARHWLSFHTENFMPIGFVGSWIPRATSKDTANQMICAFKHLLALVRSNLVTRGTDCPGFAQRTAHLNELHADASALARRYKAGQLPKASEATSGKDKATTINVDGWRRLIKAYMKNGHREAALSQFAGKWPQFLADIHMPNQSVLSL